MAGRQAAQVIARGRCDWGPQYIADAWINEVKRPPASARACLCRCDGRGVQ